MNSRTMLASLYAFQNITKNGFKTGYCNETTPRDYLRFRWYLD